MVSFLPRKNHLFAIIVISVLLSSVFWLISFSLAIEKSIFLRDRSFLYQLFWFPFHVLLAYFSIIVYKRVSLGANYKDISIKSIIKDLHKNYRAVIISLVLITPFMIEDIVEGSIKAQENFSQLGYASWVMIGPVWIIEWLMLAVIWSRVLATIRLTVKTYSPSYVDDHLDDLLILNPNTPHLQAGVENALINFFYAISTLAYIQLTGGETSDFQTCLISGVLVLFSFLASFFFLRMRINDALERITARHAKHLDQYYKNPNQAFTQESFQDLKLNPLLIDDFVLNKPAKFSSRAIERMSIVRASLLIESIQETGDAQHINVAKGLEAIRYYQFEQKLSSLGIMELQGVLIRLGSPIIMLLAKSGVLSSLH
jgi:hypothetical protein